MKLSLALLPLVAASAWAGYHQADLEPENAVYTQPPPEEKPKAQNFLERLQHAFDLEAILTSEPVVSIAAKVGINITEKVQAAKAAADGSGWNRHIPLITDENYRETIVEEPLSLDELDKRVWFLLIGIPNGDPVNQLVDERFEAAYNLTQSSPENALPHVRWGRINYLDVTAITTRWWVWKVPMLVVLRKGGRELRFFSPRQLRLQPEVLHKFLEVDGWKETPAWTGVFAPGGALEPAMDAISHWTMKSYIFITTVPRWIMLLATGALGSLLINVMHAGNASKPAASPARRVKPSMLELRMMLKNMMVDPPSGIRAQTLSRHRRKRTAPHRLQNVILLGYKHKRGRVHDMFPFYSMPQVHRRVSCCTTYGYTGM